LAYLSISFFRKDSFIHDVLNCNDFHETNERPDVWYSVNVQDIVEFIHYFFSYISNQENQKQFIKKFGERSIYVIILQELLSLQVHDILITQETIIQSLETYQEYIVFRKIDTVQFLNFIDRTTIHSDYKIKRKRRDTISNTTFIMIYRDLDEKEEKSISWVKLLKEKKCEEYFKYQTSLIAKNTKELSNEQKQAIDMMINNSICVLQGKPGAGKSHTITKFALSIYQLNPMYKPFLLFLTPTRRAGLVVENMLNKNNIMPSYCYTIHKAYNVLMNAKNEILLKELEEIQLSLDTDSYVGYIKNIFLARLKDPLLKLIIIVDESSMISWNHLEMIQEMDPTHMIMIGEEKQLPPVKQPRSLYSITRSVPNLTLREVHRYSQESNIFQCIECIEKANMYRTSTIKELVVNAKNHCYEFLSYNIIASYEYVLSQHVKELKKDIFSSIILVYMNSTKDDINEKIQDMFIDDKEESFSILSSHNRCKRYFKNDKVIGIKNDYQYNIYNSEIYTTVHISPHLIHAHPNSQNITYIRDASRMLQSFLDKEDKNKKLPYDVLRKKALNFFDTKFHLIIDIAIRYLTYESTDKTGVTPEFLLNTQNLDDDKIKESRLLIVYYILKDMNDKIVKKTYWTKHLSITLKNEKNQHMNIPIDIFTEKISLGYAITVHKSQGGEFQSCYICIVPNMKQQTLRFLRTAHSRAKQDCTYFTCTTDENINDLIQKRFKTISYNMKDQDEYILQHCIGGLAIQRFFNMIIK
jgi:hypothetical protein